MSYAELFSKNILQSKSMIDSFLADFSDAEMLFRPAKTANHAIWQMGHLANSTGQHGHGLRSERRFWF